MNLSTANTLLREKKYQEAYEAYFELYGKIPDIIYYTNIEYIQKYISYHGIDLKTRIIFVTAGLRGPNGGGGIGTTFYSMIKTLVDNGEHLIDVLYTAHPYYVKGNFEYWKNYFKENLNVNFIRLELNKKNYGSLEMNKSYEILNFLSGKENIYDVVVFHDFLGLAYFAFLAKRFNIFFKTTKFVISAHGNHTLSYQYGDKIFDTWQLKTIRYMERACVEMSKNTTAPSDYYNKWLRNNFAAREVATIKNIILFNTACEKCDSVIQKYSTVFFYGRMDRLKGLDLFIEAIKKLKEFDCQYDVVFAGTISKIDKIASQDYIERELSKTGIKYSFMLDTTPEIFYSKVIERNGFCVFPTRGETSSCVVVECACHGVPFVAAGIEAIEELILKKYHKNLLFSPGNIKSLIEKLLNPPYVFGPHILSFDMEMIKSQWISFLKKDKHINHDVTKKLTNELVTIIVPTKDRAELLRVALTSLVEQTYSDFEIIVIDDASDEWENNKAISQAYNARYIRLDAQKFKGAACNEAVKFASGKYICFFDDDDIAKPEMLQKYMLAFSSRPEVDIISCFADVFEHSEDAGDVVPDYVSLALGGGLEVNLHINFFGKGTFIVKKHVFQELEGYEVDSDLVPMVDYRFYIKAAAAGYKISILPVPLYYYRKHSPLSLFYGNSEKNSMIHKAKLSMQKILVQHLGRDIGLTMSTVVWEVGLPTVN